VSTRLILPYPRENVMFVCSVQCFLSISVFQLKSSFIRGKHGTKLAAAAAGRVPSRARGLLFECTNDISALTHIALVDAILLPLRRPLTTNRSRSVELSLAVSLSQARCLFNAPQPSTGPRQHPQMCLLRHERSFGFGVDDFP
jgi:hypothetical protein